MSPVEKRSPNETPALEPAETWADLHVLLATGLRHPDDELVRAVNSGSYARKLSSLVADLPVDVDVALEPPHTEATDLTTAYVDLFEGARTPYAPPAESPYKSWHGDRQGGLMGGPSASEMQRRYRALEISIPEAYPADHVALLLEYGSILLEAGDLGQYREFVDTHLDWIPAFRELADRASGQAPFHVWVVSVTDAVLTEIRGLQNISEPTESAIEDMIDRARST